MNKDEQNARAFKAEAEYSTIFAYCRELEDTISRLTVQVAMQAEALKRASTSLGAFCGDEGWAQVDMDTMDSVDYALSATAETVDAWKRENDAGV